MLCLHLYSINNVIPFSFDALNTSLVMYNFIFHIVAFTLLVDIFSTTGCTADLVNACYTVCPLPSACESAHVLSGMRGGLWALDPVLRGGIAGSGGSGSTRAHVLPVPQPQLPAGHPGGLLPG